MQSSCDCQQPNNMDNKGKLEYIKARVAAFPDFPKPGILFRDIFAALTDGKACTYIKDLLVDHIKQQHPEVEIIVGLDSRGFLFNLLIAAELGVGCAPVRKKGKLPGECLSTTFKLEYGDEVFELQKSAIKPGQKVVIVDDLLATGGSLGAAAKLVRQAGGVVLGNVLIIELEGLEGRKTLDSPVHSFLKY